MSSFSMCHLRYLLRQPNIDEGGNSDAGTVWLLVVVASSFHLLVIMAEQHSTNYIIGEKLPTRSSPFTVSGCHKCHVILTGNYIFYYILKSQKGKTRSLLKLGDPPLNI